MCGPSWLVINPERGGIGGFSIASVEKGTPNDQVQRANLSPKLHENEKSEGVVGGRIPCNLPNSPSDLLNFDVKIMCLPF